MPGWMGTSSSACKHRRVVGCRPVPKAMPGSSSSTASSGRGSYSASRQLGTMTVRRPTRWTKKYSFQALAQSASRSVRTCSGPTLRSLPNAQTAFSIWARRSAVDGSSQRQIRLDQHRRIGRQVDDVAVARRLDHLLDGHPLAVFGEHRRNRLDRLGLGLRRQLEPLVISPSIWTWLRSPDRCRRRSAPARRWSAQTAGRTFRRPARPRRDW